MSTTTSVITPTTVTSSSSLSSSVFDNINESLALGSGRGSSKYAFEAILSKFDRFGSGAVQVNTENIGLTFFTRPRLNMSTQSIRQDPVLSMLDVIDPLSWMFAIRCNLDTVFSQGTVASSTAQSCPFFNNLSPFNVPMSNLLVGISGFPDFNIEYETTESGYFSEDMTLARGADWGRRTYTINCTFRDIQGGFLMANFYYWLRYMALQMEGTVVAYSDDREANRLNYTCSIYRLTLDPSMTTVVKWAKATGCYPVSIPIGDSFNFAPGDTTVHAAQQFSIPFIANNVSYFDPRHLKAFNTLVARYAGSNWTSGRTAATVTGQGNFCGLPYIDLSGGSNKLQFMASSDELSTTTTSLNSLISSLNSTTTTSAATSAIANSTTTTTPTSTSSVSSDGSVTASVPGATATSIA